MCVCLPSRHRQADAQVTQPMFVVQWSLISDHIRSAAALFYIYVYRGRAANGIRGTAFFSADDRTRSSMYLHTYIAWSQCLQCLVVSPTFPGENLKIPFSRDDRFLFNASSVSARAFDEEHIQLCVGPVYSSGTFSNVFFHFPI